MEIPQHLFVGTIDGEPSCAPDQTVYDIWPKFVVMVLLEGMQHFVIDDRHFRVDAGAAEDGGVLFTLNVAQSARLRFINESAMPLRKVMISAPHPWMEWLMRARGAGQSALRDFLARHLAGQMRHLDGRRRRAPTMNRPAAGWLQERPPLPPHPPGAPKKPRQSSAEEQGSRHVPR